MKVKLKCFRGQNKPDDIVDYNDELALAMIARGSAVAINEVKVQPKPIVNEVKVQPKTSSKTPPKSTIK